MRYQENPADIACIMESLERECPLCQVYADRYVALCEGLMTSGMFTTGLKGLGNIATGLFQTVMGIVETACAPIMNVLTLGMAADDFEKLMLRGLSDILNGVTREIAGIVQVGGSLLQIAGAAAKKAGLKAEELVRSTLLLKDQEHADMEAAYEAVGQAATAAGKATEDAAMQVARSQMKIAS